MGEMPGINITLAAGQTRLMRRPVRAARPTILFWHRPIVQAYGSLFPRKHCLGRLPHQSLKNPPHLGLGFPDPGL